MAGRRRLGRAGAAALVALSAAALVQALAPRPAAPPPFFAAATRPIGLQLATRERRPPPERRVAVALVPPGRQAVRVPILMYHYIRFNPDPRDRLWFNPP